MVLSKIAGACGIASQVVVLTAVLVTAFRSPGFSWTGSDISVLGVGGSAAAVFNSGLILAGVINLVFAIGLGQNLKSSRPGRWGAASLILGSLALSAVGIFPRTIDLPHDVASVMFFSFIILAILLVGVAALSSSQIKWGLLSLTAGVSIVVFWLIPWPWRGGAIPQLLCCLPWSVWTVVTGIGLLVGSFDRLKSRQG